MEKFEQPHNNTQHQTDETLKDSHCSRQDYSRDGKSKNVLSTTKEIAANTETFLENPGNFLAIIWEVAKNYPLLYQRANHHQKRRFLYKSNQSK